MGKKKLVAICHLTFHVRRSAPDERVGRKRPT